MLVLAQRDVECGCDNSNFKLSFWTEHRIHQYVIRDGLFCDGAWGIPAFRGLRTIAKRDYQLRYFCLPVRMENSALCGKILKKSNI